MFSWGTSTCTAASYADGMTCVVRVRRQLKLRWDGDECEAPGLAARQRQSSSGQAVR